jgi:hypothetical protein
MAKEKIIIYSGPNKHYNIKGRDKVIIKRYKEN